MRSSTMTWRTGQARATLIAGSGILACLFLAISAIVCARVSVIVAVDSLPTQNLESPHPSRLSEVTPIPCHSHNDFWREIPLQSALDAGCIGVEADIWPYEGELFIGHTRGGLVTTQTFAALYIEPLVHLLQRRPCRDLGSFLGIYDADPSQTLVLLVDVKADFTAAWPLLLDAVRPLSEQGWLSHLEKGEMITGPITVVVTGKLVRTSHVNVTAVAASGVFLDAPLQKLSTAHFMSDGYYWASCSFSKTVGWLWTGRLRSSQIETIRQHVRMAHSQGLKVRYWGLPTWPASAQEHVLDILIREGVDLLNVDNIETMVPYITERLK